MGAHANTFLRRAVMGALAGTAATAAMTVVMLGSKATGATDKIGPELITEAGMDAAGVHKDEPKRTTATTIAHVGYGAGCGAAFALVAPRLPGPTIAKG